MALPTEPNLKLAKRLSIAAWVITVIVLSLVAMMRRIKLEVDADLSVLPAVNAILNTCTACVLLVAYYFIRKKQIEKHRMLIYIAMGLSFAFLACYVLYHISTPETAFCGQGWTRPVYFFVLITHVTLAAGIFPFVLFTFIRGFTGQYARHKKMSRWVFWFWLYVAVSGPIVYLMLSPCY